MSSLLPLPLENPQPYAKAGGGPALDAGLPMLAPTLPKSEEPETGDNEQLPFERCNLRFSQCQLTAVEIA